MIELVLCAALLRFFIGLLLIYDWRFRLLLNWPVRKKKQTMIPLLAHLSAFVFENFLEQASSTAHFAPLLVSSFVIIIIRSHGLWTLRAGAWELGRLLSCID